jgi:hypothetical protein
MFKKGFFGTSSILLIFLIFGLMVIGCEDADDGSNNINGFPNAPSNFRITEITSTSISLSWNPVSSAAGYYLMIYTSAAKANVDDYAQYFSTINTTITITEFPPSTTYWFRVSAFDSAEVEGNLSSIVMGTTLSSGNSGSGGGGSSVARPATAPSNFTGTRSGNNVTLTWSLVTGATSYNVYRYSMSYQRIEETTTSGTTSYSTWRTTPWVTSATILDGTTTTTSFISTNKSERSTSTHTSGRTTIVTTTYTNWYFAVSAVNSAGEGPLSSFTRR